MRFDVRYPSGQVMTRVGTLRDIDLGTGLGLVPAIIDGAGAITVLDPRAVVFCDGAIVADPRQRDRDRLAPWVRAWLDEHPEWPAIVTEAAAP